MEASMSDIDAPVWVVIENTPYIWGYFVFNPEIQTRIAIRSNNIPVMTFCSNLKEWNNTITAFCCKSLATKCYLCTVSCASLFWNFKRFKKGFRPMWSSGVKTFCRVETAVLYLVLYLTRCCAAGILITSHDFTFNVLISIYVCKA
jgi:hypothetical protein